jgi:hypothetical protein
MWAPLKKLRIGLRANFSSQSLQIFRFLLGAFLAYDLIVHFSDIGLFYTDFGIFGRSYAIPSVGPAWWSLYFLSGTVLGIAALYTLHLILALLFMAGVGLPWVTILLWVFQFSLRNRNVTLMDGSDDLAVVLVFFSIFLPLTPKQQSPQSFFNRFVNQPLWHVALTIQMLCLYSFSALQKSDVTWNSTFTAVSLALRLDILTNELGRWLTQFPGLLKISTALVYSLELAGPMVYLAAMLFQNRLSIRVRQAICLLFILFHLGLSATMRLGVFPYYCIAAWILLFPRLPDENEPAEPLRLLPTQIPSLVLSLFTIFTIMILNLRTVKNTVQVPLPIQWYSAHFSLHQNWGMFAPFPALDNYHIRTYGEFADGSVRELFDEKFWYENRHRVKYWLNMDLKRRDFLVPYSFYWCNKISAEYKVPKPLLLRTRVKAFHSVADKSGLKPDQIYTHDLWIQPCR